MKNRFVPIESGPSQGPDRETSRKKSAHDAGQSERQALLQAKEEWLKTKAKLEQEIRQKARETQKLQRSLEERDASLRDRDRRVRSREQDLEQREDGLQKSTQESQRQSDKMRRLSDEMNAQLSRISGLTREDARQMLIGNLRQEVRFETASRG